MPKSAQNILEEKLALVYEYNHASPLFVRAAEIEIKKDNLQKAVDIIDDGLKNFPSYPTAYILLGRALMYMGSYDKAEEAFARGAALLGSRTTFNYYITELENLRKKDINLTRKSPFISEELEKLLKQNEEEELSAANSIDITEEVFPNDFIADETPAEPHTEDITPETSVTEETENMAEQGTAPDNEPNEDILDERLADLAREISFAKIKPEPPAEEHGIEDSPAGKQEDDMQIVSETLAKIYISQGKFKEALEVYKKLLLKSPDKKDYYQARVIEIESQLNDLDW